MSVRYLAKQVIMVREDDPGVKFDLFFSGKGVYFQQQLLFSGSIIESESLILDMRCDKIKLIICVDVFWLVFFHDKTVTGEFPCVGFQA